MAEFRLETDRLVLRAWRTAQIATAGMGLAVSPAPTFRERHFGVLQGVTSQEARVRYPDVFHHHHARTPDYDYENGESLIVFAARVMAGLEAQSGALAAERITDAELDEIKAMHYEMLAAYTRRDLPAYYQLNSAIHRAINAAAKNPVLTATYNQVNARLQALRFRSNQDGEKWKAAVREHELMGQALSDRDPQAMRTVLGNHLNNKLSVVIEQVRAANSAATAQAKA